MQETIKELGHNICEYARKMKDILGLEFEPVGVKFTTGTDVPENAKNLGHHRYCQALMLARRGRKVFLNAGGLACPAAAAAFGFRPLPEPLKTGKGLVGFGIVSDPQVAKNMFAGMPKLAEGQIGGLYLFPLGSTDVEPDVVIVEDDVEKLMWIALADLHRQKGKRVASSTAILQATCVDATVIPFLERRLNLSYGCYGCRDATDIRSSETVLGFPASALAAITDHLEYLGQKAIANSRAKKAYAMISKNEGGGHDQEADCSVIESHDKKIINNGRKHG